MYGTKVTTNLDYVDRCLLRMKTNTSIMKLKQHLDNSKDDFNKTDTKTKVFIIVIGLIIIFIIVYTIYRLYEIKIEYAAMFFYTWMLIIVLGVLVYFVF